MEIPGLGSVTADDVERYRSDEPVAVPALGGSFPVFLAGYDDDPDPDGTHAAIAAFLALDRSVLLAASPRIFDYYRVAASDARKAGVEPVELGGPDEVWDHITPGEITVERGGAEGDGPVFVSIECECSWEPEHGLQIVLRDGRTVSRVGPFDGDVS